ECLLPGVSELQAVQVLSFVTARCCALLNSDWLLQLQWQQEEEEPQTLSCCRVQLADSVSCSAVHHCVSMETLFALSSTGLICILHGLTATHKDELTSFPFSSSASFCLLQVSADLSTAVAVTQSHAAIAVDLNHYFRMFPDHLLCAAPRSRPPLQPQHPRDQDSLSSSIFSVSALGATFSTDRSWEARLNSMYSRAKQATAPSSSSCFSSSQPPRTSSLFSSLPHLDSHLAPSSSYSRVPPGGMTVTFAVPESSASSQLTVSEFSALLTFVRPGNQQTTVALWDMKYGNVRYHQAAGEAAPVQRCGERQHRLLLKKAGVFQVLFSVSQQDLLSRLMLFGSAATVDAVCHLNSWGRCSIPIHALQTGLKNRQLDTVDFYLKSKENVLNPPAAAFSSADQPAASTTRFRSQELCPALDLLCSAVRDSNSEAQSRQFSEQLLNITLSFVNTQIRSVLSNTHHEDSGVQSCMNVLDRYVAELRSYMKRFPWAAGPDVSATRAAAPAEEEAQRDEWEQLSAEEVVHQSILTNQIPRAQAVLRRQNRPERRLPALRREGLRQVSSCLRRRDLQTANTLLANMGFSVKQQLHLICLHTDDKELRELMVSVACFPVFYFEARSPFVSVNVYVRPRPTSKLFLLVAQVDETLRLDWVKNWDQSCRTAVLLSRLQHAACDASVLWRYLTALHDQRRVVDWIQNTETSGTPRWPDLTPELVNDSTACSSYMRENILDLLARYKHRRLCTGVLVHHSSTVSSDEPCSVLEKLLLSEQPERFRKARAFVKAQGLSADAVAELISSAMVQALLSSELTLSLAPSLQSSSLKSALLDYIKRCLPADSEKYNMVALCFTMRREIGENHEIAARTQLKMIESQAWVITPELKSSLVKVLGLLKDAAESFSKDSCVRQATRCIRTAKLVALQLHFLNQGSDLRIINLRPAELLGAAMALPRCYQVFVVSEAYGYSPDWAEILYQKVVLNGDFGYLEELKRHRPLTSTLFEDIFKKLDGAPGSVTSNVKRLLTYCDDVYSRYRLAYQQNLHDITKMLLQDAKTSSYLSDRLGS
uniref:SPG11 vesicle trafficking associated, spatacsin n=1 Tax=Haplochromis burtoni TaxID=8153 RepID=A0A3Q2VZF3_HAPBU